MRTALFVMAAMLATAKIQAADGSDENEIEVRLTVYFDLSGEGEPHVMKLGREPKTFTLKIEEVEQLSLKMTPLDGCRVRIDVLGRENVTGTRPLSWPAFFEPGATFAVGVSFPRHRQEVRGSVSGAGACSRTAPNKLLEPTLETNAAQPQRWATSMTTLLSRILATASLSVVIIASDFVGAAERPLDMDRAMLLGLPWKQFDQTLGSGWRVYAARGEHHEAAKLIVAYLEQQADLTVSQRAVSNLHAAAEFARVGLTEPALHHLDQADVPNGTKGVPEDWNELVVSMRAFLLGDRAALLASKQRVEAMRNPAFPGSADRYLKYLGQRFGVWDEEAPR